MSKSILAIGVLLLSYFTSAISGVFYLEDPERIRITIEGEITPGDEVKLSAAFESGDASFDKSPRPYFTFLNSAGGDLETAIKMGRLIRGSNTLMVEVSPKSICLSSCVFLLAGGNDRGVVGRVGIHRPYIRTDKATTSDAQRNQYRAIEASVRKFLSEVNIAPSLYDDMMKIPPTNIKFLTNAELERYGLSQPDPYFNSAQIARIAAMLNISTGEYIKRAQRAKRECDDLRSKDKRHDCNVRIIGGKK